MPSPLLQWEPRVKAMLSESLQNIADALIAKDAEIEQLRDALRWAMPLVELALEDCRQTRLRLGHDDIGAGTDHIGLWPLEVAARDRARALVQKPDGETT